MLKVNKKIEYALMAIKFMSAKAREELTSASEICKSLNTPVDTTSKVLQILCQKEILTSVKGINGGYYLKKNLKEISFKELEDIIEGKSKTNFCTNSKGEPCEMIVNCNISTPLENLNTKLNQFLSELTLSELLLDNNFNKSRFLNE